MVADICGYSAMSEKDEASAIRLVDLLFKIFGQQATRHGGRVFNRAADGFLAEFPSANACMQAAIDFCREVSDRNNLSPNAINAKVRVGVHVGDVVDRDDGDILGHGVNIAARLQSAADPGMILASSNIVNLLGPKFKTNAQKRGGLNLKNISENITAYQIDPEKSDLRPGWRMPRFLKSRNFAYLIILGVVVFSTLTIQGRRHESIIAHKIETILNDSFGKTVDVSDNNVSAPYVRNVLENLAQSNIPSHQASFALLEAGNVGLAIERLENALEEMDLGGRNYVDTMHQIAALSLYSDPSKSIAYYETILDINPDDGLALKWLIKVNHLSGNADKAAELFEKAFLNKTLPSRQKLLLQFEFAVSYIYNEDYEIAINLMNSISNDVKATNDPRLLNLWKTNKSIALERTNQLDEAEALLMEVVSSLEVIGADENLPRAYNVLGQVYEKRGNADQLSQKKYRELAIHAYEKQFDFGHILNKPSDMGEARQYLGEIYLKTGNIEIAEQQLLELMRIARINNFEIGLARGHIGLGKIEQIKGNTKQTCFHFHKANEIKLKQDALPLRNYHLSWFGTIRDECL